MPHMEKQVTNRRAWLQVETKSDGTMVVEATLVGGVKDGSADGKPATYGDFNRIQAYVNSEPVSWQWITGHGARLSAPGYLDCTEWSIFDTEQEAREYLDSLDEDTADVE